MPQRKGKHADGAGLGLRILNFSVRYFIFKKSIKYPSVAFKKALIYECGIQGRVWAKELNLSVICINDI